MELKKVNFDRIAILLLFVVAGMLGATSDVGAQESARTQKLLKKYCFQCHNADDAEGDVRLDQFGADDFDLFERIYEQISSKQMPPGDEAQPTAKERKQLADHFLNLAKTSSVPETAALRRLNKREYGNTVRDLLGLDEGIFDPAKFIYKDEVEGFDTEADSLVTSNELLLEYLKAADFSLQQALFSLDPKRPRPNVINVDTRKMTGAASRFMTRGRDAFIFRVGQSKIHDRGPDRLIDRPGRYRITVTASGIDKNRYPVLFTPGENPPILAIGTMSGNRLAASEVDPHVETFTLKYDKEQTFQVERQIDKGFHPYLSFVNGAKKPAVLIRAGLRRKKLTKKDAAGPYVGPGIRVTQFKIEGPFYDVWPPKSVQTTLDSDSIPDFNSAKARLFLLGRFAKRAFRRKVSRDEMDLWVKYLKTRRGASGNWNDAVIETMTAMMASPDFLYLREGEGELDAWQLASRLSYFCWSTMPDEELFSLAESGKLTGPEVLQKQVKRLLGDERSQRFSDSFVDQWLALDTLGSMPPDKKLFREYNSELESAMRSETLQFFRHVFQENRSVEDFIDSDYTFLNSKLANLYKVPFKAQGKTNKGEVVFAKLPRNSGRGGILGHASMLTLTSNGVETSPVERGVWVLEHFMGTPPPPPPEEVPALVPDQNGAQSVRQLLEKHRSDSACMKCHRRIDPIGFALESYDPIGRFRTKYSKRQKVSTQGRFNGQKFDNVVGLKKILSKDVRPFARNLIVRIAEYAKGRKLVAADYPTVEAILDSTEKKNYRLQDIVYQIATSDLMTRK